MPRTEPVEAKTESDNKNCDPGSDPSAVMPGGWLWPESQLVWRRTAENSGNAFTNRLKAAVRRLAIPVGQIGSLLPAKF
jgi:hypothetical protein